MIPETIVIGHRNPDTDSVAAAYALAELKKARGGERISAACAGLPGERTEYLFNRFQVPLPPCRNDIYPRVRDVMNNSPLAVKKGHSLIEAISMLEHNRVQRLPVVDDGNRYCGMLSLFNLLSEMLQTAGQGADSGLTGRKVRSSIGLINEVLKGEPLSLHDENIEQDFEVYVAAMNIESFKEHIPRNNPQSLAIVVGDRADIHLMGINIGARIMIITGSRQIDEVVIQAAVSRKVSIIKTPFDSATVIRRLKFSCPVELLAQPDAEMYSPEDCLCDIRRRVFAQRDDIFPVTGADGQLRGTFSKSDLERENPFQLIMVDHNEFDQGIAGIEEVPGIEVVDHHRLGMPPTNAPIKITCDIVGSTCTLVAEMFINHGVEIPVPTAGILMGGIIADTLMLRSPTSTARDRLALEHLQTRCGVNAEELTGEIFKVGSLIARLVPREVLCADKKDFTSGKINFSVAQVEEVSFEQFRAKQKELIAEAKSLLEEEKLDFFGLLVTNVVRENSVLLAVGNRDFLGMLPYRKLDDNLYDLPGILSRKKQLLPQLLKIAAML